MGRDSVNCTSVSVSVLTLGRLGLEDDGKTKELKVARDKQNLQECCFLR